MFNISGNAIVFAAILQVVAILCIGCSADSSSWTIVANVEEGVDPGRFYMPPEWNPPVVHVVSANRRLKDRGVEVILESVKALSAYQYSSQRQRYNFLVANASEPTKRIEAVTAVFYGDSSNNPLLGSEVVFTENGVETPKALPPKTAARVVFSVELRPDIPTHAALWIKRIDEEDSYFVIVNLQSKGGYINLR